MVEVTNGQIGSEHYGPIGDVARQIASYCEGYARANVYTCAFNALTTAQAQAAAIEDELGQRVQELAFAGVQAAAQEQRIAELEGEVERLRKGNSSIPLKRSHQITLQTHINLRTFARYPNVEEAIRAALGEHQ